MMIFEEAAVARSHGSEDAAQVGRALFYLFFHKVCKLSRLGRGDNCYYSLSQRNFPFFSVLAKHTTPSRLFGNGKGQK